MGRDFPLILPAPILALNSIYSLIQQAGEIQRVSQRLYWRHKINVSLRLGQAGSTLTHSCGNPTFGCEQLVSPQLCWSKPSTWILGHHPKSLC